MNDSGKMKINKIYAKNYKAFSELELTLNGKSTVLFGINGTGKSSILSILNFLSWNWLARLNPNQGNAFRSLEESLVKYGNSQMEMSIDIALDSNTYILKKGYTKAKLGKRAVIEANKKLYDTFLEEYIQKYGDDSVNIPIFVNYGTNRSVLDIPVRIRKKHNFSKWTALERTIENELDYRTFFEWFRNQEDYESEIMKEKQDLNYRDPYLESVRTAVEAMMVGFSDLRIKRNPLGMYVHKNNKEINVGSLSDGEKCTLALLGDLSRRLALANPARSNPLEGEGIVLIDEIELHMHPQWQRRILDVLRKTFPNIQFIITTHSPQVLGEIDDNYNLIMLKQNESNDTEVSFSGRMDGYDANYILETFMGTESSNQEYKKKVDTCYTAINESRLDEAKSIIDEIINDVGRNYSTVIMLEGAFKRRKILNEKNNQK